MYNGSCAIRGLDAHCSIQNYGIPNFAKYFMKYQIIVFLRFEFSNKNSLHDRTNELNNKEDLQSKTF